MQTREGVPWQIEAKSPSIGREKRMETFILAIEHSMLNARGNRRWSLVARLVNKVGAIIVEEVGSKNLARQRPVYCQPSFSSSTSVSFSPAADGIYCL